MPLEPKAWCEEARTILKLQPTQRRGSAVQLAQAKLAWNTAKKTVGGRLVTLRSGITGEFPELVGVVDQVTDVLSRFNEGLADTLDAAYVGEEPERDAHLARASEILANYRSYITGDKKIEVLDRNPYVALDLRALLTAPLDKIASLI